MVLYMNSKRLLVFVFCSLSTTFSKEPDTMALELPEIVTNKVEDVNYICLCSDGKSMLVNPIHLSHFSGYFSSLLHSEMKETKTKSVTLKLISSDILQLVLNLLTKYQKRQEEGIDFLAKSKICMATLRQILHAADYLDMPVLREVCDEHVCRSLPISSANFEDLLALNHRYSLTRLGQTLVNYISGHVTDLCSSDGWLAMLSSALLEDLLACNNTKVII